MTDEEFNSFVERTTAEAEEKQADLTVRFGLGTHASWNFDQLTGFLRFADSAGHALIAAKAINIGSYSAKSMTW
jgi:hypothetical protein